MCLPYEAGMGDLSAWTVAEAKFSRSFLGFFSSAALPL